VSPCSWSTTPDFTGLTILFSIYLHPIHIHHIYTDTSRLHLSLALITYIITLSWVPFYLYISPIHPLTNADVSWFHHFYYITHNSRHNISFTTHIYHSTSMLTRHKIAQVDQLRLDGHVILSAIECTYENRKNSRIRPMKEPRTYYECNLQINWCNITYCAVQYAISFTAYL
jgi:hypothetical protein